MVPPFFLCPRCDWCVGRVLPTVAAVCGRFVRASCRVAFNRLFTAMCDCDSENRDVRTAGGDRNRLVSGQ
jgi:hypothetical protein